MKERRNHVRSKGKPKCSMAVAGRGHLVDKTLLGKRLNGQTEASASSPRQSAFFLDGEEIRHGRCRSSLCFRGSKNGGDGMEAVFFCPKCVETVSIPHLVLAKVLQ